jgi:DHA2 family multidrug resistance protein
MIPLSQTLLLSTYPKEKAGTALAMWSITTLVAPVLGPVLGGWITDNISWPWIFYINVPVGLAAAAATWAIYAKRETPTRRLPIDSIGLGLLVLWVGALQIMLDKGKDLDWFHSGTIVILAVVAALAFALFLVWELTDEHPVVDLRLFAQRNFAMGTLAIALGYLAYFGNVVLLPLWLQQYMGYTATLAGLAMAPVGLLAIFITPMVGKNLNRVDPRVFATISFAVFALVMLMRSHFNTQADFTTILVPTIVQGAAVACFFIPLVTLTLSGLRPDQIAGASGLSNFARITAGSFGTSISTTLWDHRATLHHAQLAEHVSAYNPNATEALAGMASSGLTPDQSAAMLNRMIDQQAFMMSANDIFYASAILFVLLIGVVWLTRPVRGGAGSAEAAGAH